MIRRIIMSRFIDEKKISVWMSGSSSFLLRNRRISTNSYIIGAWKGLDNLKPTCEFKETGKTNQWHGAMFPYCVTIANYSTKNIYSFQPNYERHRNGLNVNMSEQFPPVNKSNFTKDLRLSNGVIHGVGTWIKWITLIQLVPYLRN